MEPPITQGLCIRPFQMGDAEAFAVAVRESATSVGPWLSWCRTEYSKKDARTWIGHTAVRLQMGFSYDVGIFSADDKTLFGSIAINQIDHLHNIGNIGNIGYWVRETMQRQGIATRAVRIVAPFGFDRLKLIRLEIIAAEDNRASRGVAEKAGATFECIARNRLLVAGKPVAAAVYSLILAIFRA